MADYTNMTLEEKKQKLAELKNKLAELKATQELSGQSKGFESAIDKMMDYDPNQAFNLMDRREAVNLKKQQMLLDKVGDSKEKLLNEMKALTYAINTTSDQSQKELLSTQLKAINKQYLSKFGGGGKTDDKQDSSGVEDWLNNYINNISLDSYGTNADGTIQKTSQLIDDIKSAARIAGYTNLASGAIIDKRVEKINDDRTRTYNAKQTQIDKDTERAMKKRSEAGASWSVELERAKQAYNDLKNDPSNITVRNEVLDVLLRSETGAAIAKQETLNRLATLLPSDEATKMQESVGGISGFLASKLQADEAFTANLVKNYVSKMDVDRALKQLNIKAGGKATDNRNLKDGLRTGTGGKPSTYPQTKMINGVKWTKLNATSGWKK